MTPLSGTQVRQLTDATQLYQAYLAARGGKERRFAGSMSWKAVAGRDYLYRKVENRWVSLGPRSEDTEQAYDRFQAGRAMARERVAEFDARLRELAPVNRALRLGRVPSTAARILRRLERAGALGRGLRVAGTHALYAYEMLAGIHFESDELATRDIDLLYDARVALTLAGDEDEVDADGLIGTLRRVDRSFEPTEPGSFRAVNKEGFMVDLITPMSRAAATSRSGPAISQAADELRPVEIEGLAWLVNVPAVEAVAIDEKGYPLSISSPDPRAFALHKWWLAGRADREPVKRRRDRSQAVAVARMIATALPELSFDDPALSAMPASLRETAPALAEAARPALDAGGWN